MIQTQSQPLKHLFNDVDYAWQLLEGEVRLETSPHVSSEDVAYLLQLYMKGVEKMNSFLDYREAFFKERVMTLMSRPTVMKTLNNKGAMGKKNVAPLATADKEQGHSEVSGKPEKGSSGKKENKNEMLQLKQKKMEIEMRLAYGVEENTPDLLHKMVDQQSKKEQTISSKIHQIVENHEQRLMKRIRERKLKTTAKSLSNALINNSNDPGSHREIGFQLDSKALRQKEMAIESCILLDQGTGRKDLKQKNRRPYKSLEVKGSSKMGGEMESPLKRSISYNMAVHITKESIKLWNFSCPN